jgi:3-hydroxyisobutyrate dehydrogenase-like beta-hydroxyacid dehydrogenase
MAKIGMIGLGALGTAMAECLLAAGHTVVGFNRTPEKATALAERGLQSVDSAAAASAADIVFSVLLDDAAARAVLWEADPFEGTDALHVSVSTIGLPIVRDLAHRHAARGQAFVSAPVFGRPDNVRDASAVIAVGGAPSAVDQCRAALACCGQVAVVGADPGAANAIKMAGNFLMASAVQSLREALELADAAGGDRQQFVDIVTTALFPTSFYQRFGGVMAAQGSDAPAINPFANSARLIARTSRALSVPTPLADALADALDRPLT